MTRGRTAPPKPEPKPAQPQLSPDEQRAFAEKLAEAAQIPVSQAEEQLAKFIAGPQSAAHRLRTRLNAKYAGAVFVPNTRKRGRG